MRNYSRKANIVSGGISFLIGATLNVAAVILAMLILLGRIMLGVGISFGNQAVPLYLSEMAPAHLRGGLSMMFQLATTLGIFMANLINYSTRNIKPWGWRLSLGLAAAPALLMSPVGSNNGGPNYEQNPAEDYIYILVTEQLDHGPPINPGDRDRVRKCVLTKSIN